MRKRIIYSDRVPFVVRQTKIQHTYPHRNSKIRIFTFVKPVPWTHFALDSRYRYENLRKIAQNENVVERKAHQIQKSGRFSRKCEICQRSTEDSRVLGPLIQADYIWAHYNCVLFSPKMPGPESLNPAGICGVSSRFIRKEESRAKLLVISFAHCVFRKRIIRYYFSFIWLFFLPDMQLLQEERSSHGLLQRHWQR